MALTSLNDIKNWFKTNFIPTQQQFWDMFDSFRHKNDKVAATDVDGLNTLLAAKASNDVFQAHLTANNAHAVLFGAKVDKVAGKALSDQNYSLPEKEKLAGIYDWVNTQIAGATIGSTSLGSINPTTTIPDTINVHGIAMEAGTYANCGGVVVPANSLAFISRIGGVWSISKTAFDLSTYQKIVDGNKINPWTAKSYASGDQVNYLGKDWVSNAVTVAGDVPGTSSKWVERLSAYGDLYNKISGITFTNGIYIKPDGTTASHPDLSHTNFIPLEGISCIKSVAYTFGGSASYLLYDVNQVLITGYLNTKNSLTIPETIFVAIPLNAKFIRFVTAVAKQSAFYVDTISLRTNELQTLTDNLDKTNVLVGVVQNAANVVSDAVVVQASTYFNVNGVIKNYTGQPNEYNISLDYIGVLANKEYKQNYALNYGYICFYDSNKNLISTIVPNADSANYIFTTPANCRYVRATYKRTLGLKIYNNGTAYVLPTETISSSQTVRTAIKQDKSSLGALEFEPIPLTGYNHIIFNGQSLSVGAVSQQPISTVAVPDCFMLGANVGVFSNTLTPLVSAVIGNSGEQPVVGAVNALKKYLNKTPYRNVKLIASSVGQGGQTIEQLSKIRTESNGLTTGNLYNSKFIASLDSAKTAVGVNPIVCTAIVWMQGEANQDPTDYAGTGLTTSLPQTHSKDTYKALLKQLKSDMQSDIMTKYGQSFKPLFFVYQTSNQYTFTGNIPITQAQYELAQEEEDVILLNPHYYCPTAQNGGGHLNANGYRWYGEQVAKTLSTTLLKNDDFASVIPKQFTIDSYNIYIDCLVPVAPLVIDTKAIQLQTGYGFTVKLNGVVKTVSSVEIIGGTTIKLTVAANLSVGTVDVSYGGAEQSGKGNVRDSDKCLSLSNYIDDTTLTLNNPPYTPLDSSSVNFYGKRYPLWNWLSNFYINIQ